MTMTQRVYSRDMTLERAIEVFATGFTAVKSLPHPYICERIDGLWVMRDGPGRKVPRKIEVIVAGLPSSIAVERVQRLDLGRHFLCNVSPLSEDLDTIKREFKSLGYRAMSTEWMSFHNLKNIPKFESEPQVRLVPTQADADLIPQLANQKIKLVPGASQFCIWDGKRDYGWVRSIPAGKDAWVADLFVRNDVRGRGYGRALMSSLLQSDRDRGAEASVLLGGSAGTRLYPHLGYEMIGVLQVFGPSI